jgi:hydrogenase expression/formation protein HypD
MKGKGKIRGILTGYQNPVLSKKLFHNPLSFTDHTGMSYLEAFKRGRYTPASPANRNRLIGSAGIDHPYTRNRHCRYRINRARAGSLVFDLIRFSYLLFALRLDLIKRKPSRSVRYQLPQETAEGELMQFVDEFRKPDLIKRLAKEIKATVTDRPYRIMEICGGHTHSIYRFGLEQLLPENIELIHGPGCPVCVLPVGKVDEAIELVKKNSIIFTAFGDVMRVPGSKQSPLEAKAEGADIRMVYSPTDALKIALANPDREVVFFAIGFETTAPSTALTILNAARLGLKNFSVFCNHVTIEPPLRAIMDNEFFDLDGFIGPGHVSTVIGTKPYTFVAREYHRPIVVSGFEPADLMESILMLVQMINAGEAEVKNQYVRAVNPDGNAAALVAMREVFEDRPSFEWRGLGYIPSSALRIRSRYAAFDAELRYSVTPIASPEPSGAICGDVLIGLKKPEHCPLLGTSCSPENPIGALMVSSEGACSAYYTYVHRRKAAAGAQL